jgi:hypothetical protein
LRALLVEVDVFGVLGGVGVGREVDDLEVELEGVLGVEGGVSGAMLDVGSVLLLLDKGPGWSSAYLFLVVPSAKKTLSYDSLHDNTHFHQLITN